MASLNFLEVARFRIDMRLSRKARGGAELGNIMRHCPDPLACDLHACDPRLFRRASGDRQQGGCFTNDFFGDGRRPLALWVAMSCRSFRVRRATPAKKAFGDIIEYRLGWTDHRRAHVPVAAPGDRPYVGAVAVGRAYALWLHMRLRILVIGADVLAIGPQTGLSEFQRKFHDGFEITLPPYVDATA